MSCLTYIQKIVLRKLEKLYKGSHGIQMMRGGYGKRRLFILLVSPWNATKGG